MKHTLRKLIIIGSLLVTMKTQAMTLSMINTEELDKGIIKVSAYSDEQVRMKAVIEKEGVKYTYDLSQTEMYNAFPLQMGNGMYKISVYKNTDKNKYKLITSKNVTLAMAEEKNVFLNSVQNINWNADMEVVKLMEVLTSGKESTSEKIRSVYNYLKLNMKYDYTKLAKLPSTYLPDIEQILIDKKGICYDFSTLFAAMLRSEGIPSKVVMGYHKDVRQYHSWNEVYDEMKGRWVIVDLTYDITSGINKSALIMEKAAEDYIKLKEY